MTTTVTVETHDWPVTVTVSDNYSHFDDRVAIERHGYERQFVPAHTKRQFNVTASRVVAVEELPKDATGLQDHRIGFGPNSISNQAQRVPEVAEPGDEVAGDGA